MSQDHFDLIVVGAGPAGLLAAGNAAQQGANTLLLEKMDRPGRKLQLTGKGRCNLTNTAPLDEFILRFGRQGRFLRSAFSEFFSQELLAFLAQLGIETQVERGGRVFPRSQDAAQIVNVLEDWNRTVGVKTLTSTAAEQLVVENGEIRGIAVHKSAPADYGIPEDKLNRYSCEAVIVATGGASYPGTGSTGDGYRLARDVGHTVTPIRPALVPLVTRGDTAASLQGLSLRNVQASLLVDGELEKLVFGEMLFTHFGLSGPIILTLSRDAVDALLAGHSVSVSIDLKPALDGQALDARLLRELDSQGKKQLRSILKTLLPQKMIPTCLTMTGLPGDKIAHQVNAQERQRLKTWLKDLRFEVIGHRSFRQAIITAGGIDLSEVDPRSMASRLVHGLYFAGEVLDLDADTGGYNLQAAFSTGWLAGRSAAANLARHPG